MKNKDRPHHIDRLLLEYYIKKNGLNVDQTAERINISVSALRTKLSGKRPFLVSEMYDLIELLNIAEDDVNQIFHPE